VFKIIVLAVEFLQMSTVYYFTVDGCSVASESPFGATVPGGWPKLDEVDELGKLRALLENYDQGGPVTSLPERA